MPVPSLARNFHRSRSLIFAAWSLVTPATLLAEERSAQLRSADIVVVGRLEATSYFLWLDGLHVEGNVLPTEVLYGATGPGTRLPYRFMLPCSPLALILPSNFLSCDYRTLVSRWSWIKSRFTQDGLWLLWRAPGGSWTQSPLGVMGAMPLDSGYRAYAVDILADRRRRELEH